MSFFFYIRLSSERIFSFDGQYCNAFFDKSIVEQVTFPLGTFFCQLLSLTENITVMIKLIIALNKGLQMIEQNDQTFFLQAL